MTMTSYYYEGDRTSDITLSRLVCSSVIVVSGLQSGR